MTKEQYKDIKTIANHWKCPENKWMIKIRNNF
jgi:hypothetical protein